MNSNELIKLITDNNLQEVFCEFGMGYNTLSEFFENERYEEEDKEIYENIENLKLDNVESVDSCCNSDELYNVVYFKDYNIYLKFTGEYDSYGSGDHNYDGAINTTKTKKMEWESLDKEMEDYFSSVRTELNTLLNRMKKFNS